MKNKYTIIYYYIKYSYLFITILRNTNEIIYLNKIYYITRMFLSLLFFGLLLYIILHYDFDISNIPNYTFNIDEKVLSSNVEIKQYTIMDFFGKGHLSYFPSYFVKPEFIICNKIEIESERDFLLGLSYTFMDLIKSNEETTELLQKFLNNFY